MYGRQCPVDTVDVFYGGILFWTNTCFVDVFCSLQKGVRIIFTFICMLKLSLWSFFQKKKSDSISY